MSNHNDRENCVLFERAAVQHTVIRTKIKVVSKLENSSRVHTSDRLAWLTRAQRLNMYWVGLEIVECEVQINDWGLMSYEIAWYLAQLIDNPDWIRKRDKRHSELPSAEDDTSWSLTSLPDEVRWWGRSVDNRKSDQSQIPQTKQTHSRHRPAPRGKHGSQVDGKLFCADIEI